MKTEGANQALVRGRHDGEANLRFRIVGLVRIEKRLEAVGVFEIPACVLKYGWLSQVRIPCRYIGSRKRPVAYQWVLRWQKVVVAHFVYWSPMTTLS